ncbi:hypothetical protein DFH28DRAFT_896353 [Melampsora americana]|nr:hypothetical protein DFH28DRAFT_896353 [Melampsora americana]
MRKTRSQAAATSTQPIITSTTKSSRPKRKASIESSNSNSNRKQLKTIARSTHRPVFSARQENQTFDNKDVDEIEDDDVLEVPEFNYNIDHDEEEEEEDSDSEEILNHLSNRINTNRQEGPITQTHNTSSSANYVETENLPSIKDYKNVLNQWPPARIAVVDRSQKKKGTAVPPLILIEARAIQKLYKQQKAMLSIMGNISQGELGGRRQPGCYQIWLKYSKERQNHMMPLKGGQKGILANRNRKLGQIWKALPNEHQEVFNPSVFYTLSGLAPPSGETDDDVEAEQVQRLELEPEHRGKLQALYDDLVCKDKVAKEYAKVAAGIGSGPSLPDYNRQSLKCIECINTQIENEAKNMDFSYYLLACSTHASTEASSASPGWCREFTSQDEMVVYVNTKSNFARVFAACAQGLSVAEVVAQTIGSTVMSNTQKARKTDPGDLVKRDLAALLRTAFSTLIGKDQGFPRGPDPVSILRDNFDIKIIQMPGSKLTSNALKLGFNRMNSGRNLWLEDIKANLFRMEKITKPNLTTEDDIHGNESDGKDQVTMTQVIHQNTGVDDLEMGFDEHLEDLEKEEWNGFGDIDDSEGKNEWLWRY